MWDVSICYSWEGEKTIASPVAQVPKKVGLRVCYDEFALEIGNSLCCSINCNLNESVNDVIFLDSLCTNEANSREAVLQEGGGR